MKSQSDNPKDAPAVKSGEVLSYVDEPDRRYVEGLKTITKAKELRAYLAKWPFLAEDAIRQAARLTDADVQDMQKNRAKESEGERVARRYGAILLPARLMELSMLADHFKATSGMVYIRLWTTGVHDERMALRGGNRG